ncbi:spore germination protein [Paenibacillus frigoriresistens]|uniref:spore germination protein n=1 Tax=Paenibacillus alginolyticus TaxID=59839 RepID=UPI0015650B1C|nr:spore germination protein [Paenibacillus frigoriresistens]NRF95214.1 spore germination protein [Paenibacillus frigoriresistens]
MGTNPETKDMELSSLQERKSYFQTLLNNTEDLVIHTLNWNQRHINLIYLATLTDQDTILNQIIFPLKRTNEGEFLDALPLGQLQITCLIEQAVENLLNGACVVDCEGETDFYIFYASSSIGRSITEPINEKVFGDSHEGFIERLNTNLHLIRRKVNNKDLMIRYFTVGMETNTRLALVYIESIANPEIVTELEKRITSIRIDYIASLGFVEQLIEDVPFSPFPQILSTERVDRVAANLMEGRIAVLAEGSAKAIILPINFFAFYQSPDDYNARWINGSFFRMLRVSSFFIAITLPALYISVVTFHFETIPNELVLLMQSAVLEIPFPPIIEALLMEITIEMLREAGLRLHTAVGQTIGIVGGLVIGDAIVKAGLVSNIMIIVVASTALASFVVPSHEFRETVRFLRFPMMMLAATFGFLGITFGFTCILIHLCKLEGFGTPYFYPFSPFKWSGLKDSIFRLPIWKMNRRPEDSLPQKKLRELFSRGWVKHERRKR